MIKNILYISTARLPSKMANSVHVMKMCAAMVRQSINTTLLAIKGEEEEKDVRKFYNVGEKIKIKRIKAFSHPKLNVLYYNINCFWEIVKHKDLVYLRYIFPVLWCLLLNRDTIVEFHSTPKSKMHRLILQRLFHSTNFKAAVFITHRLEQYYLNLFDLDVKKCIVLADGCDIPASSTTNEVLKSDIGYVGHLYEGRGMDIIIELGKRLPESNFHIIGGTETDVAKFRKISSDNIQYYGFMPQAQLIELYKNFSIVLAPYQLDVKSGKSLDNTSNWMSPMKVFEYMAFKKAIVMSDLPALREIGEDNIHFLYVKHNDVDDWEKAIKLLQNDERLLHTLIDNSFEKLQRDYTWDRRVEKINAFLTNNGGGK